VTPRCLWDFEFSSMVPLKNKGGKLYIGFIRPILEYGGIVWDNCSIHEYDLLESVQLEAACIITGLRKGTSHAKLYTELG
jgi:hypothetical protein